MSQAAAGPDGSNSPARRYCMFYKLMVASILQDKAGTLLLETFVGGVKILLSPDKITVQESVKTYQKSFVNNYGNELSSIATLTVPRGRICLMELQKVNKLWFHKGWHEFVECYSIGVGENFNEHVHSNWVQSTYTASLEKPHARTDAYSTQFNGRELTSTEDGVSSLISGIAEKTRRSKRMIETNVDEHESLGNQKVKLKPARAKITSETLTRRWRAVTPEEKHIPSFCSDFLGKGLQDLSLQYVALGFAEKYLNQVSERIKLQVSDGREWPLRVSKCERKLSKGWNRFHKENDLKEGDTSWRKENDITCGC
ncbi:hypothetical protein NC651_022650 [Populus alba x Populus x berolinensis]|nr:hypothetical protein NC651_022650 [Populus alba x Populus x berolinensis]